MTKPIISFGILILSLGFAFFYVKPAYDLNEARRGDIESLTKILNISGEIQSLIEETKVNLGNIDSNVLSRFKVFLPAKIDPIRFANNIQSIGLRDRIILSDINIGGASASQTGDALEQPPVASTNPNGKYIATSASFGFTTTYETFQLFLSDLERSLGLINVTSLSFSPVSIDTSRAAGSVVPEYQYTMTIESYSLQ